LGGDWGFYFLFLGLGGLRSGTLFPDCQSPVLGCVGFAQPMPAL
jgi:hypothetical protein